MSIKTQRMIMGFLFFMLFLTLIHAAGWSSSVETGNALCSDNIDNDGDGYVDWDDPSCNTIITGYVFNKTGDLVFNASVYIKNDTKTYEVKTDVSGYYETMVPPGTYTTFATNQIMRSLAVTFTGDFLDVFSINHTLEELPYQCTPQCTLIGDSNNICNQNCLGLGGCTTAGYDNALAKCHGLKSGIITNYNDTHRVVCCNGAPYRYTAIKEQTTAISEINKEIDNLIMVERVVVLNGKTVTLNIVTYKK